MKKQNIVAVIPARLASSRFPNKPLAKILGLPMVGHCYFRAKLSGLLDEVYVATCDREIAGYIESVGGSAVMTKATHQRASDRTAEAVGKIEKKTGKRVDIVVMLQGDEPMVTPEMIDSAVEPLLKDKKIQVVNLMSELKSIREQEDPNEVKVVVDLERNALYFSREPIPSRKKGASGIKALKQVCIIPFRRDFLFKYLELAPTPLEIIESVDMNRILEHGFKVKMVYTDYQTYAVDTLEDLLFVEKKMRRDPLLRHYLRNES